MPVDIEWPSVIVSSVIALGIAMFFRYAVKPEIEKVYENNRTALIQGMLNDIYTINRTMREVFTIIENQSNFDPNHGVVFTFNTQELNRLRFYQNMIHNIYLGFLKFNDWRGHIRKDEFFILANYVNYSDAFMGFLVQQPFGEYVPSYLEERRDAAKDIMKLLRKYISSEFKRDWQAVI